MKHNQSINPIEFINIEIIGNLGYEWLGSEYRLNKVLTQNILYSAYHEAKSIKEISEILNVQASFIENIVYILENEGFMNKVANEKYVTNTLIHDFSVEVSEKRHRIFTEYAKIFSEIYIPLLFKDSFISSLKKNTGKLYTPLDDDNFLMWNLISFACSYKTIKPEQPDKIVKHYVQRNDGSEYIVATSLKTEQKLSYQEEKYRYVGPNTINYGPKEIYPFSVWLYNTYFDNRGEDWKKSLLQNFIYLYEFIKNNENDSPIMSLYEHALLSKKKDNSTYVNIMISTISKNELLNFLPDIPDEIFDINKKLCSKIYNISKSEYPQRMQKIAKAFYQNVITSNEVRVRVLEYLLKNGVLKPLTDEQKKTVNMIMFVENAPIFVGN